MQGKQDYYGELCSMQQVDLVVHPNRTGHGDSGLVPPEQ